MISPLIVIGMLRNLEWYKELYYTKYQLHFLKHSFLAKVCIYLMLVLARQFLNKGRSNNSLINVVYKICCGCLNFLFKQSVEFVNLNTQSGLIKGKYRALILQILSMI